jgi:hypothetical protein
MCADLKHPVYRLRARVQIPENIQVSCVPIWNTQYISISALTVRSPRFLTRQCKKAVAPSCTVMLLIVLLSKLGSVRRWNSSKLEYHSCCHSACRWGSSRLPTTHKPNCLTHPNKARSTLCTPWTHTCAGESTKGKPEERGCGRREGKGGRETEGGKEQN